MATLGEATVKIRASLAGLKKDLAKAKGMVKSAMKGLSVTAGIIGGVGGALGKVGSIVTGTVKTIVGGIKNIITGAVKLIVSAMKLVIKVVTSAATIILRALKSIASAAIRVAKIATVAILGIGIASSKMAADAEESENLFTVAFGNMGDSVRAWSDDLANALGLNRFEVRKMASVFVAMFKSLGFSEGVAADMSMRLTELTNDLASFFNLPIDVAFQKLQAGITGEIEPLKRLGILVDEATVKQFAYTNGIAKSGKELTQMQKVQARFGAIQKQTTLAQGDLARTLDSTTNVFRTIKNIIKEMAVDLGMALNPAVNRLGQLFRDFLLENKGRFREWAEDVGNRLSGLLDDIEFWFNNNKQAINDWWEYAKEKFNIFKNETLPALKNKVIETFSTFKFWLIDTGKSIDEWRERLEPAINTIKKLWDDFNASVKEFGLVAALESIANVIGEKMVAAIKAGIDAIAKFVKDNQYIIDAGISIGAALGKGISAGVEASFPELFKLMHNVGAGLGLLKPEVIQINPRVLQRPLSELTPGLHGESMSLQQQQQNPYQKMVEHLQNIDNQTKKPSTGNVSE